MFRPAPAKTGGFILAGGRSRRMGRDKALLRFEGAPLIEWALAAMRGVAAEVWIVGRRPDLSDFAPLVEDRCQDRGPLGGIEAALAASPYDLNLFLPVDTPFVPRDFLQWMLTRATISGAVATVPVVGGDAQPLIAIYSKRLLPGLSQAIEAARLKTIDAVIAASREHGGADLFRVEMTSRFLPLSSETNIRRWFENLNTPEDLGLNSLVSCQKNANTGGLAS